MFVLCSDWFNQNRKFFGFVTEDLPKMAFCQFSEVKNSLQCTKNCLHTNELEFFFSVSFSCSNHAPISSVNFMSCFISCCFTTGATSSAHHCWPVCLRAKRLSRTSLSLLPSCRYATNTTLSRRRGGVWSSIIFIKGLDLYNKL